MSRDSVSTCRDIIDAVGNVEEYVAGLNYEASSRIACGPSRSFTTC